MFPRRTKLNALKTQNPTHIKDVTATRGLSVMSLEKIVFQIEEQQRVLALMELSETLAVEVMVAVRRVVMNHALMGRRDCAQEHNVLMRKRFANK
jgi:hypothetical protein